MNLVNGKGELTSIFACSEQEEFTDVAGFEHKKKFLDPKLINFSSPFKPGGQHNQIIKLNYNNS